MMKEELTFLYRGILLDEGIRDSTEGGAWVDWPWAIVLEVHGGFLASVRHDDGDGDGDDDISRDGEMEMVEGWRGRRERRSKSYMYSI